MKIGDRVVYLPRRMEATIMSEGMKRPTNGVRNRRSPVLPFVVIRFATGEFITTNQRRLMPIDEWRYRFNGEDGGASK